MRFLNNIYSVFLLIISANSFAAIENTDYMTCHDGLDSFTVKFDQGKEQLTYINLRFERTMIKQFNYINILKQCIITV